MKITVHEHTEVEPITAACDLFARVWADGPDVVPADLAVAVVHMGGYCATAHADGRVVGASFGVLGAYRGGPVLHSHVTASMLPGAGYALKTHQRDWAASRGIPAITWTFDPLVRRNAYFNLVKLGCSVTEYLPDFYGPLDDAINAGDRTDRLMAVWDTRHPRPHGASPHGLHTALQSTDDGPRIHGLDPGSANLVELPADIEAMRAAGDSAAPRWRDAVRDVLGPALATGWAVTGMAGSAGYVLEEMA